MPLMSLQSLRVDPDRRGKFDTGIMVRAFDEHGKIGNADLGDLNHESMIRCANEWGSIRLLSALLRHEPVDADVQPPPTFKREYSGDDMRAVWNFWNYEVTLDQLMRFNEFLISKGMATHG